VEGPLRVPGQSCADFGLLVGRGNVEDDVDGRVGGHLGFDGVQKPDELMMPMSLHVATDIEASRTLSAANRVVVPLRL
jgi:hypothetical protein